MSKKKKSDNSEVENITSEHSETEIIEETEPVEEIQEESTILLD